VKINNWKNSFKIGLNGRKYLRRSNLSNNEVVAPEEEEEGEEEKKKEEEEGGGGGKLMSGELCIL
jgi:hypothetical protein